MSKFFYGWYFRCQTKEGTVALIPAVHISGEERSCSLQVITEEGAWNIEFPIEEFRINRKKQCMKIGEQLFSRRGIHLHVKKEELEIHANLTFGRFTKPKYDIMGPFQYLPRMECVHTIYSLEHLVEGTVWINGKTYWMKGAKGYMEGDAGRSFPKEYVWTQSFFQEGTIVLAAATIPVLGCSFTGTIGIIWWRGREYRFATYLGASVVKMSRGELVVKQGKYQLKVKLLKTNAHELYAPCEGKMTRRIREDVSCPVRYSLICKGKVLFEKVIKRAAFEYEVEEFQKTDCPVQQRRI